MRTAMDIQLLYFDGCPNWLPFEQLLRDALTLIGSEVRIAVVRVESPQEAERLQFRGSPSLLVNGCDPFADPTAPVGLSCRVFSTPEGLQGTPTMDQLVAALRAGLRSQA